MWTHNQPVTAPRKPSTATCRAALHWFRIAVVTALLVPVAGCQLADMVRFSYANARATTHWSDGVRSTSVPFTLIDNHIVLPVSVNGSEPLRFVLDSGAAGSVIVESRGSRALSLRPGRRLPVSGVGDGPDPVAHVVEDTSLALGALRLEGLSLVYLPLESLPFFDGEDEVYFDGVIGAQFFSRFIVEIDYDRQVVSFTDPALAAHTAGQGEEADTAGWQSLPLQIESGVPYIATRVSTRPGQALELKLLVDTGARGLMAVTADPHRGLEPPGSYYPSVSQGLSGDVHSRVGLSSWVALGNYRLRDMPLRYTVSGGESAAGSDGILSNTVLSRFNLRFDYPDGQLSIQPNRRFAEPIGADRSGLLIRPHTGGAVVKDIAAGSAAASSSLRPGDILTRFDDRPVTAESVGSLKQLLASGRSSVHLCWTRGQRTLCEDLPLASRFALRAEAAAFEGPG